MDIIYCSGHRHQHYFPPEGDPLFCLTFFFCHEVLDVPQHKRESQNPENRGWGCRLWLNVPPRKSPKLSFPGITDRQKHTKYTQNTCPSPEADAGTAILSLGPLHSKETFWRWIRLSSMKHKGLLVLRLSHIHTNNWTSPHLHFQRGSPLKYCGIILSTPKRKFTLGAKSLVLAATCEHAYVFAKVCMHIQCQFYTSSSCYTHIHKARGGFSITIDVEKECCI